MASTLGYKHENADLWTGCFDDFDELRTGDKYIVCAEDNAYMVEDGNKTRYNLANDIY